jgi:hypothetical protein
MIRHTGLKSIAIPYRSPAFEKKSHESTRPVPPQAQHFPEPPQNLHTPLPPQWGHDSSYPEAAMPLAGRLGTETFLLPVPLQNSHLAVPLQ